MRTQFRPAAAVLAVLALGLSAAAGQGTLSPPTPFAPAPAAISAGETGLTLAAAQRAHDLGLLSTAASLYRNLLADPAGDRPAAALALASVLLDAGDPAAAEAALAAAPGSRPAAWQLRAGLAALQLRRREAAQAAWDAVRPDELPAADRAWYLFLQGALYDTLPVRDSGAITRANEFYNRARDAAPTDFAKARFQLAAERVRLQLAAPTREDLEQTRRLWEQYQGREAGYEPARQYAVKLALLDRRGEAVQFLRQQVLLALPAGERGWRDEFNFLVGMFGDRSRNGLGRNALLQLLANGSKPERQRQALQLLADASPAEPERGNFKSELNRLIALVPAHPLRESLLYFRAQLALAEKDFAAAEENANRLLLDFPGTAQRVQVLGLLTQSAWEQQRFRLAAENARKAREALPAEDPAFVAVRAKLGVLEAEARFRAGDYRYAADVYAAVLRERSPEFAGERLSALIFQRVLSEIRAGATEAAQVLDAAGRDPAFRLVDRWQAEWSLARALQLQGRIDDAFRRVAALMVGVRPENAPAPADLPADLRARMGWLHARLAFDAERFAETLPLVDDLLRGLGAAAVPLRDEIASTSILLKARAEFALQQEAAALETLLRLRTDYPRSEAAIYSYLIESQHFAAQEKIGEAQLRLTRLIDNADYRTSPYVPFALFELALLSERLGQEKDLAEANKRIEQLVELPAAAADSELIFAARLKQGDLLRRLSQFPQAQRAYEYLVNRFSQRPDVVLAQLALADCHNAQSSADGRGGPSHADNAQRLYEQLRDRFDAPPEVRVEAGYKLGLILFRRGQTDKAVDVWWKDVVTPFLLGNSAGFAANDKRPYWLAATLFELGRAYEARDRLEEARRAYSLVLQARLGIGESLAREALKRLGVPEVKP
ncbi:MAG: hypothetical protein B9S34_12655 [Opitutia bacterium Tous-C1TDCM]|nr:MAG: hypothetical protein B9S34_12655 [Opitutae bacterium Tous-C1TDCM]